MPHESLFLGTGEILGGVLTVCIHYKLSSFGKTGGLRFLFVFFPGETFRTTKLGSVIEKIDGALVDPVELNQTETAGHRKTFVISKEGSRFSAIDLHPSSGGHNVSQRCRFV